MFRSHSGYRFENGLNFFFTEQLQGLMFYKNFMVPLTGETGSHPPLSIAVLLHIPENIFNNFC